MTDLDHDFITDPQNLDQLRRLLAVRDDEYAEAKDLLDDLISALKLATNRLVTVIEELDPFDLAGNSRVLNIATNAVAQISQEAAQQSITVGCQLADLRKLEDRIHGIAWPYVSPTEAQIAERNALSVN